MTADDLKKVAAGMPREELLKFGAPASRITMFDDGHLLEVFSYATKDASLGRVRLTDGSPMRNSMTPSLIFWQRR